MSDTQKVDRKSMMIDFGGGGDPFSSVSFEREEIDDNIDDTLNDDEQTEDNQEEDVLDQDESNSDDSEYDQIDDQDDIDQDEEYDDSSEDDSDTHSEEDSSDDEDLNMYYHIAKDLKQDSFLPEDLDIDDKIDGFSLKEKIKTHLKEELLPQARVEAQQQLLSEGYNQEDLIIARALRQGVDPRLLSESSMYDTFSKAPDDSDISYKEQVISQMYRIRGFNEAEIKNQIDMAKGTEEEIDPAFDELFSTSKSFFKGKHDAFVQEQNERDETLRNNAIEASRQVDQLFNDVLSNKKILDVDMDDSHVKSFDEAIRRKQIVEVGGQKYQATELQKFLYDFQTSDEVKLLAFYLHKFRDEQKETAMKKAKREVEGEFMKSYKQRVVKKSKASKNKRKVKDRINENREKGNPFFIDFSK